MFALCFSGNHMLRALKGQETWAGHRCVVSVLLYSGSWPKKIWFFHVLQVPWDNLSRCNICLSQLWAVEQAWQRRPWATRLIGHPDWQTEETLPSRFLCQESAEIQTNNLSSSMATDSMNIGRLLGNWTIFKLSMANFNGFFLAYIIYLIYLQGRCWILLRPRQH